VGGLKATMAYTAIPSSSKMVLATFAMIANFPGRVEDGTELRAKSGLLEIARYMLETKSGHYRLTGNQHVIVAGITSEHLPHIKEILAKYKLDNLNFSGLRLSS
jgi:sulfite reductase beta subunit-like hemoprotein